MSKSTLQSDEGAECTSFLDMPGYLLRRCHQIAVAIFLEECRDFDLTPLQYVTLAALDRFGSMDQVTLGGVTALDRTTILGVLRKLEERALITRTTSDKDKRANIVAITEDGRRTARAALPNIQEVQKAILSPLNGHERARLLKLLKKLADGNNGLSRAPYRLPSLRAVSTRE
ncbi:MULTISPECIES: MarR family winged helix-turn-helix transcriptional regulator [Chelativorans]|jgi:DNA-binding MarR family transcriptional regulator|uniref:Transcriptional regulator, MarR family n=1 Tax=Chelativorans sp. (strain BNC1) TaxID=266779 RepID=Q11CE2_CHESB|nr:MULTISPECIES: MarR family transcriptional regulator [Chelativorans]